MFGDLLKFLKIVGTPVYKLFYALVQAILFILFLIGRTTRKILGIELDRKSIEVIFPRDEIKLDAFKSKWKIRISWDKAIVVGSVLVVSGGLMFWLFILRDLPSPRSLTEREQEVSTKIYDRNDVLLFTIYKDKNRTLTSLEDVSEQVKLATLAAEDAGFYNHPGFSIRGILRSVYRNMTRDELTGGSTITQQLVKNALLTPEKTLQRKLREVVLSIGVEVTYSKDEILEMYLNEVAYGGSAYGISEAAKTYFEKDLGELTLMEAAYLAGLPKSPTKYSPFGETPEAGVARAEEVLRLMQINGFITKQEEEEARNTELVFAENAIEIKAPHFVMYVKQILAEKYGEEVVETGGLTVKTTLDWKIQKMAEEVVSREIESLGRLNVTNGAAVVLDPETGEILAMVGSHDYFDLERDGNVNVTTRLRQPGSSIKVVNYAYALSTNYTPASVIADRPTVFKVAGQEDYIPRNYDGKFRGNVTLRSALAESRNIPAVRILATYGVEKMIELGSKMGISSWVDPSNYGLSLTLGGGEVRLLDLAKVYATIANYGRSPELVSITRVSNYKGKTLESWEEPSSEVVLDERVSYQLIDILSDNVARTPAFGSGSTLVIPNHPEVAVKTGTSNNLRDNLTVGFNQDYLVAVWVGNNDNTPMARIASGVTGASSIWNRIMSMLVADSASIPWRVPDGLSNVAICTYTGTLTCGGCPTKTEWFLEGTAPEKRCDSRVIESLRKDIEAGVEGGEILPEAASTF